MSLHSGHSDRPDSRRTHPVALSAATLALVAAVSTGTATAAELPDTGSTGSTGSGADGSGSAGSSSGSIGSGSAGSSLPGQPGGTNDGLYEGHVDVSDAPADDQSIFTGRVFDDANKNSSFDEGEKGVPNVTVSNGLEVATTDDEGRYELPVHDNVTLSVTQPAGWQVPVDQDNFAQFSYNHLPEGSTDLKFGGLEPTGDVPESVNFPLAASEATADPQQSCPIAADTQTYDKKEVGYAENGAPADLKKRDDYAGCGVMLLGDNVGDDLSLNPDLRSLYTDVNGPVRALPGNHDMDYDAADDSHATDTYRQNFGATHYSYDVGETHFIALDNIEYNGVKSDGSKNDYLENIGEDQLKWLSNDLDTVPTDKQVVVYAHAPIVNYKEVITDDALDFYKVLADHPNVVTVGGHTHTLENLLAGEKRAEWSEAGLEELPYDQIVAGAVSGDWYSGGLNDNGVPYAYTSEAAEPGIYTQTFNGSERGGYYTVRGEEQDHQQLIGVNSPSWRKWAEDAQKWQDNDKQGDAPAEITQPASGEKLNEGWEFTDPISATENLQTTGNVAQSSPHLWRAPLPGDLEAGEHTATVTTTDCYGAEYTETVDFTVE